MKDGLIPLHDILREIKFLNSLRDRTTFESFRSSSTEVRAASYSIMVISEAVRDGASMMMEPSPALAIVLVKLGFNPFQAFSIFESAPCESARLCLHDIS